MKNIRGGSNLLRHCFKLRGRAFTCSEFQKGPKKRIQNHC